jgi:steroid 5-alpha reductase family enzyme
MFDFTARLDLDYDLYDDAPALGVALLGLNVALWLASLVLGKTWPVDFIWSTWPILHCAHLLQTSGGGGAGGGAMMALALTMLWGLRLTYNFAVARSGIGHEDWRYQNMRRDIGATHFWWVSLFSVFLGQSCFMFVGCLSFHAIVRGAELVPFWSRTMAGATITASAILLEVVSDQQMNAFIKARQEKRTKKCVLDTGLWSYSRHPNYFGEFLFWFGLFVMGGARPNSLSLAGPACMFFLFWGISIELMETRQRERKGAEWEQYVKDVPSAFFLRPPSRPATRVEKN